MIRVESNPSAQLLTIVYSGRVEGLETSACLNEIKHALADMRPGFRLLADFSAMAHMDPACAHGIGEIMDLCGAQGVHSVTRVIPDPRKDIGLTILSFFHYGKEVVITTCESLEQAMREIG